MKTEHGEGKVVDTQILTQLVVVETDVGVRIAVPVEEIELIDEPIGANGEQNGGDRDKKGDEDNADSLSHE